MENSLSNLRNEGGVAWSFLGKQLGGYYSSCTSDDRFPQCQDWPALSSALEGLWEDCWLLLTLEDSSFLVCEF